MNDECFHVDLRSLHHDNEHVQRYDASRNASYDVTNTHPMRSILMLKLFRLSTMSYYVHHDVLKRVLSSHALSLYRHTHE